MQSSKETDTFVCMMNFIINVFIDELLSQILLIWTELNFRIVEKECPMCSFVFLCVFLRHTSSYWLPTGRLAFQSYFLKSIMEKWLNNSVNWISFPVIPLLLNLFKIPSCQTLLNTFDKFRKTPRTSKWRLAS